jgi:hypothetical protein
MGAEVQVKLSHFRAKARAARSEVVRRARCSHPASRARRPLDQCARRAQAAHAAAYEQRAADAAPARPSCLLSLIHGDALPRCQAPAADGAAAPEAAAEWELGRASTAVGACPVCGLRLPAQRLQAHVEEELGLMVADSGSQPQRAGLAQPRSTRTTWQQGRAAPPGSRAERGGQGGARGGARASARGRGVQRAARPSRVRPWRRWRRPCGLLPVARARPALWHAALSCWLPEWGTAAVLRACRRSAGLCACSRGRYATVLCKPAWSACPRRQVLVLGGRPEDAPRRAAPAPRRPPPRYNHYADGHQDWVRTWHGVHACSRLTSALACSAGCMFVQGSQAPMRPRRPDTSLAGSQTGPAWAARSGAYSEHALQYVARVFHTHAGAGWRPLDRLQAPRSSPRLRQTGCTAVLQSLQHRPCLEDGVGAA